jgi:hypothetical protein
MEVIAGLIARKGRHNSKDILAFEESLSLKAKRRVSKVEVEDAIFFLVSGSKITQTGDLFFLYTGIINNYHNREEHLAVELFREFEEGYAGAGNYSLALYDSKKKRLKVEVDSFGIRPIYYCVTEDFFAFCSEFEPLLSLSFVEKSLNKQALADFLTLGLTMEGDTFFKSVKRLPSNNKLMVSKDLFELKEKDLSPSTLAINSSIAECAGHADKLFKESLSRWITHYGLKSANLTGGADTRLILANLSKEQKESFTFNTECSVYLDEDSDKDVIVAKRLASSFRLKHKISKTSKRGDPSFENFNRRYYGENLSLSGSYGGEVFGADAMNALGFAFEASEEKAKELIDTVFSSSASLINPRLRLEAERKVTQSKHGFSYQLLFNSFFNSIYEGGTWGHWLMPCLLTTRKMSPFWDTDLLNYLSQIPEEKIRNYKLYSEVFGLKNKKFKEVPLNSPLAVFDESFEKLELGSEPKESFPARNYIELFREKQPILLGTGLFSEATLKHKIYDYRDVHFAQRCFYLSLWLERFGSAKIMG